MSAVAQIIIKMFRYHVSKNSTIKFNKATGENLLMLFNFRK